MAVESTTTKGQLEIRSSASSHFDCVMRFRCPSILAAAIEIDLQQCYPSTQSNGNAALGSNNVIFGFAAGMDHSFTPDLLAGFALAGAGTTWRLANGLGTGKSDAFGRSPRYLVVRPGLCEGGTGFH